MNFSFTDLNFYCDLSEACIASVSFFPSINDAFFME